MSKWRPRIVKCDSWSIALLDRITSSIRIRTCRVTPFFLRFCCWARSRSMRVWFHSEKKKRVSHFSCLSIMLSRTGQHAALPTNATTRSNVSNNLYTRFMTAVDFPLRRAPTAANTTGNRSFTRSGSHSRKTISFIVI